MLFVPYLICYLICCSRLYISNNLYFRVRPIEITQKWITKVTWEVNVLEEKRNMTRGKFCIKKTNMFTIIAMNFVLDQLKTSSVRVKNDTKNSMNAQKSDLKWPRRHLVVKNLTTEDQSKEFPARLEASDLPKQKILIKRKVLYSPDKFCITQWNIRHCGKTAKIVNSDKNLSVEKLMV